MSKWLVIAFCLILISSGLLFTFVCRFEAKGVPVVTDGEMLVLAAHYKAQDWSQAISFMRPRDEGSEMDEFITWADSGEIVSVKDLVETLWHGDKQILENDNLSIALSPDFTQLLVNFGRYDAYNSVAELWMYDLSTGQKMYVPDVPGIGMMLWDQNVYVASMSHQGEGYVLANLANGEVQRFLFEKPVSEFHIYEYNDKDGYLYGDGGYCPSMDDDCPSSVMRLAIGAQNPEFVELLPHPDERKSQRLLNNGIVFSRSMVFKTPGLNLIENNSVRLKSYSSVYGRVTYLEPLVFSPSGEKLLAKVVIKPDNLPFEGDITSCFTLDAVTKEKVYDLTVLFEDMLGPYSTIMDCFWIDDSIIVVRFGPYSNQHPAENSLWKINTDEETKEFILDNVGYIRYLSRLPLGGYAY